MTPEQFAYWLQGFAEMKLDKEPPTREQWEAIKEHLQTVFKKVTPPLTQSPYVVNPNQPLTMPGTTTTPCKTDPMNPYTWPYQPTVIC